MPATADKLRTLELYLQHQNASIVAEKQNICITTVFKRLRRVGVTPRPQGASKVRVEDLNDPDMLTATLKGLREQAARDKEQPKKRPIPASKYVSAADKLRLVELMLQHNNTSAVAKILGVAQTVVLMRLNRLGLKSKGSDRRITFEQLNGVDKIAEVQEQLRQAAKREILWCQEADHRRYSAETLLETLEFYEDLQTRASTAQALGVNEDTVSRRLRTLGLKLTSVTGIGRRATFIEVNGPDKIDSVKRQLEQLIIDAKTC